ncbi:MAG: hypothetical protein NZ583_05755 [Desulfobacterota bacterium]|nr:hypothetical protein [Thermodesulfobacteriota bacterium]
MNRFDGIRFIAFALYEPSLSEIEHLPIYPFFDLRKFLQSLQLKDTHFMTAAKTRHLL